MPTFHKMIELSTNGNCDMRDITVDVQKAVDESGLRNGIAAVFAPGSTTGVTTIEYESGALDDLKRLLDSLAPQGEGYAHNLRWGDGNGHSHLRSALIGTSASVPFIDGKLTLGTWQQILFIDFDVRSRRRGVIVMAVGEQ